MKIEITRKLENKVFSSSFKRVVPHDDPDTENEKVLENDFGPVKLNTGKVLEAAVKIDEAGKVVIDETEDAEKNLRFNVKGSVVPLINGATFTYSCDAKNETGLGDLTPLQVAEVKCKVYEEFIRKEVKEAVVQWKSQKTEFEKEVPAAIIEKLTL